MGIRSFEENAQFTLEKHVCMAEKNGIGGKSGRSAGTSGAIQVLNLAGQLARLNRGTVQISLSLIPDYAMSNSKLDSAFCISNTEFLFGSD